MGVIQRFPNVTPERFSALKRKALDFGLNLNANKGSTSQRGFTVNWKYDPDAKMLEIQCTNKPFLVPWSAIDQKIAQWVEQ